MANSTNNNFKKFWFWLSISANIGLLMLFKYYNFFVTSLLEIISISGLKQEPLTLNIILPIGISFYTFHGLSYVIDIYKGRIKAERNLVDYALFVSFFPLLVAGPIERATHLLPQIQKRRIFNYTKSVDGLKQILWGLFKKIVIADQCGDFANLTFNNTSDYSGSTLLLGAVFFAFQIYGDFSGYSDIALGTARLFGIELLRNFSFPYFSRDIAEFWQRWHISLSSWFRDYLYIPLGGSKGGIWMKIRNTFIIFLVSGFWHGANWTFIVWGFLNALYIMPSIVFNTNRKDHTIVAQGKYVPSVNEIISIITTFGLTVFAWIFFRAENLEHAFRYISNIFSDSLFALPTFKKKKPILTILAIFLLVEWLGREEQYAIAKIGLNWPKPARYFLYYFLTIIVIFFMREWNQEFIYFQF